MPSSPNRHNIISFLQLTVREVIDGKVRTSWLINIGVRRSLQQTQHKEKTLIRGSSLCVAPSMVVYRGFIKGGVELGSGALGPQLLDRKWGIFEPWVGIGLG